jgi:thiol-disulfide isomerase/thioredoxin
MCRLQHFTLWTWAFIAGSSLTSTSLADDRHHKLLGAKPPEWQVRQWINSPPLKLEQLRGKVVLVRWWTGGGCPYCIATAPALNDFHEQYKDKGLAVIGMYHHKATTPLDLVDVKRTAEKFKFQFPVGVDEDWRTLKDWWLKDRERSWTSVTFLLDRKGVIRHIHPGGKYVAGDEAYVAMKDKIEELLREKE